MGRQKSKILKALTDRFQQFKREYNAELMKIYKETKCLFASYEEKMRKNNIAFDSSDEDSVVSKEPSVSKELPASKISVRNLMEEAEAEMR